MPSVAAEIRNMGDEELFTKLKQFGMDVGPIMASTRVLYEKKLAKLLDGESDVVDSTNNDIFETPERVDRHSPLKTRGKPITEFITMSNNFSERQKDEEISTRKRVTVSQCEPEKSDRSTHYNTDLHVLSPRPSLRSVMSTTSTTTSTKYITPGGSVRETTLFRETYGVPASSAKNQQSTLIRFLVKLFIISVILIAIYIIYQYVYSESPFKELENLARQTVGSIQNSKADSKDSIKKSSKVK